MIRELEEPKIKDLFCREPLKDDKIGDGFLNNFLSGINLVGSGKAAITLVLKYLNQKKILASKLDEILVPDWLGYWVYNQMQPLAFPTKYFSDRTKVIFVYHQYGFPQDMDKILSFAQDKKLIVIEDCAHAIESYYKGRRLGDFGDFSIYSFSKWFFCFALGGVKTKFADFFAFVDRAVAETPIGLTSFKDFVKFFQEKSQFSKNEIFRKYANLFLKTSYAIYGDALRPSHAAQSLLKKKIVKEIKTRQNRYHYFLKQTDNLGICDHLERDGVTPQVIPIRVAEAKIDHLVAVLRSKGFMIGRYHFDIERNLLAPQFVPVVWIPCHSDISDEAFSDLTEETIKIIRQ